MVDKKIAAKMMLKADAMCKRDGFFSRLTYPRRPAKYYLKAGELFFTLGDLNNAAIAYMRSGELSKGINRIILFRIVGGWL